MAEAAVQDKPTTTPDAGDPAPSSKGGFGSGNPDAGITDKDVNIVLGRMEDYAAKSEKRFEERGKQIEALQQTMSGTAMPPLPEAPQLPAPPAYKEPSPFDLSTALASAIGALGARKARQPVIASLNAMSAAINAGRQRNVQDFELQQKAWKQQSEYAYELNKAQYDRYRAILEDKKLTNEQALNLIRAQAELDRDEHIAHGALTQDMGLVERMINDRATLNERKREADQNVDWHKMLLGSFKKQWADAHNGQEPPAEAQAEYMKQFFPRVFGNDDMLARNELFKMAKEQMEQQLGRPLTPEEELALRNKYLLSAKDAAAASRGQKLDSMSSFYENTWIKQPGNAERGMEGFIEDWQRLHGTVDPSIKAGLMERRVQVAEKNLDRQGAADAERARHNYASEDLNSRKFDTEEERKKAVDEERKRHNMKMEELYGKRGSGSITQMRAQAIEAKLQQIRDKEHREPTAEEQTKAINDVMKGGMTGNKVQQLQTKVDLFDDSLNKLDTTLGTLNRYIGAAGAPGEALRLKERVGNLLGSNETDRVQMMRDIEYLQMMGTRLMTESGGRPLSHEAERISHIIAGLNMGDTTANTKRSLDEIRQLYTKMRADTLSQLMGTWQPGANTPGFGPGGGGGGSSKPRPWAEAPIVGQ